MADDARSAPLRRSAAPMAEALLPAGFADLLPASAEHEAALAAGALQRMALRGYRRVAPPLLEYEKTLASGPGAAAARRAFRLHDPDSPNMMALRADMTPQVARIAATRLREAPRPLRLCYAGQVVRASRDQLRPERQFGQVGAELIGEAGIEADLEILAMVLEALEAVGVRGVSVDLSAPTLAELALAPFCLTEDTLARLRDALDHKDAVEAADAAGPAADFVGALIAASGPADEAAAALDEVPLTGEAADERDQLTALARALRAALPDLSVTVDPVERYGFHYHAGPSFSFFAEGVRGELGRGGRYRVGAAAEPAVGATLYVDTVARATTAAAPATITYVPHAAPPGVAADLRAAGTPALRGLQPEADAEAEARRLGCAALWTADGVRPL